MCTLEKRGNLFVLILTGEGHDHRLSPAVISSLLSALSAVKSQATPGTALLTTAHGSKFFSNGFDLAWARSSAASESTFLHRLSSMVSAFRPVVAALLALAHDYLVMRSDRGVLYMSEVDIGLSFPDYFAATMRAKIGSAAARREVMLVGRKIRGDEAVAMGIAESAHGSAEEALEAASRLGEQLAKRKWKGDVYAAIRMSMFPDLCQVLGIAGEKPPIAAAKL